MRLADTLVRCVKSFADTNMYFGERLWWSGTVALLSLVSIWLYVIPQVYFGPDDLGANDWLVAMILGPVMLAMLMMVFGKVRRTYAMAIVRPDFLSRTPAGQRLHDQFIAFIWFFNIIGIPIAAIVLYHVVGGVGSLARLNWFAMLQ